MKLITVINGSERHLELQALPAAGGPCDFSLDEERGSADIREVAAGVYSILLGARSYEVKIEYGEDGYSVVVEGHRYEITVRDPRRLSRGGAGVSESGPRKLAAPMPGKVMRVMVEEGQQVEAGQGLVIVEAMKMQNELKSPKAGVIKSIQVAQGGSVGAGQILLIVE